MKVTEREFRIAAVASLFGFFCCYFLVGEPTPPRGAWKMTVVGSLTNVPAVPTDMPVEFQFRLNRTNAQSCRVLPMFAFVTKSQPELPGHSPSPRVDLFSSRCQVEVDLNDLQ